MHSSSNRRLADALVLTLIVVFLASCALPEAGPQVIVTRVPVDLSAAMPAAAQPIKVASADTSGAVPRSTGGSYFPAESQPLSETLPVTSAQALSGTLPMSRTGQEGAGAALVDPTDLPNGQQASTGPTEDPNVRPLQRTHNILLIGTDQRQLDYIGRTDTIMVLALDEPNHRAALISFPRDIYLPIPGVGYSRINTAYSYGEERKKGGGLPLLISTIDKNFGVPIDNFVRIDFSGFEDVVDALGGVDVTVDCPLYDELIYRYFGTYTLEPGDYHMNGQQALYYARSRKTTSDFDRARRQQRVLLALRKRMMDADMIPRVPALWMALRDTVDTDMSAGDVAELAKLGASMDGKDLYGMVIRYPLVTDWVTPQGGMVQLPDLPGINKALDNVWKRAPLQKTNDEEKLCPS